MIKKYWTYLLLLCSFVFFLYQILIKEKKGWQVKPFKTHYGWGYNILRNDTIFIHQEIIPAIEGRKSFASKDEAIRLGELVVSKIKQGKGGGLPQITIEEIDSLKITR